MALAAKVHSDSAFCEERTYHPSLAHAGQKSLKSTSVLIVGAGGLGSPSALYLAGAGIGVEFL